jgi:hypothetical protein
MTGHGGDASDREPESAPPLPPAVPDLMLSMAGLASCEAGEACRIEFAVRNVGEAPYAGLLSLRDEPGAENAALGDVGPQGAGWSCLFAPGRTSISCLSGRSPLGVGEETAFTAEIRLPRALRDGSMFENCAALAPPDAGPNPVLMVQYVLAVRGIDPGPIDGLMGRKTASAIEAFQGERGMAVTGDVDEALIEALRSLALPDANAANDQVCISVPVTKTITCGFGEQVVGESCQASCPARNDHWNGDRCVTCGSGERWSADRLRCVEAPPDCDAGTTTLRGGECRCAYNSMERVSATRCRCPSGTELVSGEGCVRPQPQCPFGKIYNSRTGQCDFICIPPGYSTARGCACPNGQQYRIFRGCAARERSRQD